MAVIRANHQLANTNLRCQMAHAFGAEQHGVVVELLEILRRCLFDTAMLTAWAEVWAGWAAAVKATSVGRQEAAGMGRADL
jgi:hypothetical protein